MLSNDIQCIKGMIDKDMLQLYVKYWKQYKYICKQLNGSCNYVNRHWVEREHHDGRRDILTIGPVRYFSKFSFNLLAFGIF